MLHSCITSHFSCWTKPRLHCRQQAVLKWKSILQIIEVLSHAVWMLSLSIKGSGNCRVQIYVSLNPSENVDCQIQGTGLHLWPELSASPNSWINTPGDNPVGHWDHATGLVFCTWPRFPGKEMQVSTQRGAMGTPCECLWLEPWQNSSAAGACTHSMGSGNQ